MIKTIRIKLEEARAKAFFDLYDLLKSLKIQEKNIESFTLEKFIDWFDKKGK